MNSTILEPIEGLCRICGGPLLGNPVGVKKFYSGKWTDEGFIRCPSSRYICQPCDENKRLFSKNFHKGFVATEKFFKWFDTAQDIKDTLCRLPDHPFVLMFKTWPPVYKRHVIFFTPVNFNKEQVSSLFVFHPWHNPGKTKDDSMTAATMFFTPQKVLQLINKLESKGHEVYQVNPVQHGPELHLATYILSIKQKEIKKIQGA